MDISELSNDVEFDFDMGDGRIAHCWRAQAQPYQDCMISAGLVSGIDPDTRYLMLERDGDEPLALFLRPDEMLAILHVCAGAMWSGEIIGPEWPEEEA
jgi:hypothetical protein